VKDGHGCASCCSQTAPEAEERDHQQISQKPEMAHSKCRLRIPSKSGIKLQVSSVRIHVSAARAINLGGTATECQASRGTSKHAGRRSAGKRAGLAQLQGVQRQSQPKDNNWCAIDTGLKPGQTKAGTSFGVDHIGRHRVLRVESAAAWTGIQQQHGDSALAQSKRPVIAQVCRLAWLLIMSA